jgi:calnexin
MPEANQHYGLSTMLPAPVPLTDGIVLQYEVKFDRDHTCGGAYLKLLSAPEDGSVLQLDKLKSKTPFSVMFGPDRCGGGDTRVACRPRAWLCVWPITRGGKASLEHT